MGTHGDLGTTLKWKPPFPDMAETFKLYSKKAINDAVALINARMSNPMVPHRIPNPLFYSQTDRQIRRPFRLESSPRN